MKCSTLKSRVLKVKKLEQLHFLAFSNTSCHRQWHVYPLDHSFFRSSSVFRTLFNISVRIAATYNCILVSTNAVVQLYSMISHNIYRTISNGKKVRLRKLRLRLQNYDHEINHGKITVGISDMRPWLQKKLTIS